ncbi:beta-ketoacyl synthase N-terminal-like domain-containing protein [Chromobacterium piscinae]|uniref:Beta-ketoacyl synthase N-terminal-like domain-containing protein n=7 Tax=Chromobacterium piscinae TaxID=686831 RepID=A0ABV0H4V7_9NEIS
MLNKGVRRVIGQNRPASLQIDAGALFKNKLLLGEKISDDSSPEGELVIGYRLSTKNNVCFRDHIVNDTPCISADVYLELVYVAFQAYLGLDCIAMSNVIMSNPIVENKRTDVFVRLYIKQSNGDYIFKLVSNDDVSKKEKIHIRGIASNVVNGLIKKGMSFPEESIIENFDVEYFYQRDANIYLGSFYRSLRSLNFFNGYAIGEISILEHDQQFSMSPRIINAAIGSAITFSSHCVNEPFYAGENYFLPYSIDGLKLYTSFTEKEYRCIVKLVRATKNITECCLQITNVNGDLVFEITNFKLQKVNAQKIINYKNKITGEIENVSNLETVNEDIAIIGIACRFPKSNNFIDFWRLLKTGKDCIEEVPAGRWAEFGDWYHPEVENYGTASSKFGGFIESYDCFDPLFFNISPAEAELMDPQQRIFLEEAWSAIENAGYAPSSLENTKCGVYVGCAEGDYLQVLTKANKHWEAQSFPGTSSAVLAARISYFLNLKGPSLAVDTSCSSSLTAIHLAAESIRSGENDLAIAGGINIFSSPLKQILTSQIGMQSKDGRCHTFDQRANGTVFSEGCGVILLKKLSHAIEAGDNIWGVIKGSGINQDGKTNGITAPSAISQENLLRDVYKKYNLNPEKIGYVEAHGTGTVLGDPIEIQGLKGAFEKFTEKKEYCVIGSLKSNIGHAVYSAGVAGIIKVLLCLKYQEFVPSINYSNVNKNIDFTNSPFIVNKENRPWRTTEGNKRLAAVSSFGFSGSNAHIVIEEYVN